MDDGALVSGIGGAVGPAGVQHLVARPTDERARIVVAEQAPGGGVDVRHRPAGTDDRHVLTNASATMVDSELRDTKELRRSLGGDGGADRLDRDALFQPEQAAQSIVLGLDLRQLPRLVPQTLNLT